MSVLKAPKSNHPAWIVTAVLLLIAGPFIAVLTPVILTVTTYQYSSRITYVPLPNAFAYYLGAFILSGLILFVIYFFSKRQLKIAFSIVAACLFIVLFYGGINQFQYFDKGYIEIGSGLEKKQYNWTDVEEAIIVVDSNEYRSLFLKMNDRSEIEILLAGLVNSQAEMSIRNRLMENEVEIQYAD